VCRDIQHLYYSTAIKKLFELTDRSKTGNLFK